MVTVVCHKNGSLIPLVDDDIDYEKLLEGSGIRLTAERNSRIEVLPGSGIRFGIYWLQPELVDRFGELTDCDEAGLPLRSHRQAVELELRMLTP